MLIIFYTALWRAQHLPRIVSDCDGEYLEFGNRSIRSIKNTKNDNFHIYYDDYSMWDIYRAQIPLFNMILKKDIIRDMVISLLQKAEQGGWLPIFPAWQSYTDEMIGDHCSVMISDAFLKGIIPINDIESLKLLQKAFYYLYKNAMVVAPKDDYLQGKGRRALESYLKYGFIPLDDEVLNSAHTHQQVRKSNVLV